MIQQENPNPEIVALNLEELQQVHGGMVSSIENNLQDVVRSAQSGRSSYCFLDEVLEGLELDPELV